MSEHDFESEISEQELVLLAEVADRLERGRPTPAAAFRGDLRRSLLKPPGARRFRTERRSILAAAYSGLGALLLAVAAAGLVGLGPFAA
jgi:hypothetical protein